jgi:hypothetical protein
MGHVLLERPPMRRVPRLAALIALGLLASAVAAQDPVYTWVDGSGVRHYAQTPPDGVKYEIRGVRDRPLGSDAPPAAAEGDGRTPEEVRACDRARLAVQQLNSNIALEMDKDGDGKPEALTPEDRNQQRRLAEQSVAAYCGAPGAPRG